MEDGKKTEIVIRYIASINSDIHVIIRTNICKVRQLMSVEGLVQVKQNSNIQDGKLLKTHLV